MRVIFKLEAPANLQAAKTTSPNAVTLSWSVIEDYRAYSEIEVYCREQGQTEWKLSGIADRDGTGITLNAPFSQEASDFEDGHTYEFSAQSYGPVYPAGPGEDNYSNVVSVTF